MPTGYTNTIKDGISFKDFTMKCARAFGALIEMRDAPMDAEIPEFKQSTYNEERLKDSEKKLANLRNMSYIKMCDNAEKEYNDAINRELKYSKETSELRKSYNEMLLKVRNWQAPTTDHIDLKNFMIEQITSSIKFDCSEIKIKDIKKLTGDEWLEQNVNNTIRDIKYHTKESLKELDRVNRNNLWVKQLKESLSND